MPFLLNGVDVEDLRVNGVQVDSAYLNGVEVYQRIGIGTVLSDGGIVFGQEIGDWLVVAPASLRTSKVWKKRYKDTVLRNYTTISEALLDVGSSEANTNSLIKYYSDAEAAEYCRAFGYDLPSAGDLALIYNNRSVINAVDSTGNLPTSDVWSSTEYNFYQAWIMNFGNGNWSTINKPNSRWVVPFKRIPV